RADQVVVATGPFQAPYVPQLAERLAPEICQTHSTGYRKPSDVPQGMVLVVGGGNTGFQIAKELAATHKVYLSVGSVQKPLPQRLLGRDLFWWLTKSRLLATTVESRLGRKPQHRDTLICSSTRAARRYSAGSKTTPSSSRPRLRRSRQPNATAPSNAVRDDGFGSNFRFCRHRGVHGVDRGPRRR